MYIYIYIQIQYSVPLVEIIVFPIEAAIFRSSPPSCPSPPLSCGSADRRAQSRRPGGGSSSGGRCRYPLRSSWESSPAPFMEKS